MNIKLIYQRLEVYFFIGLLSLVLNCKSNDMAISNGSRSLATIDTLLEKENYFIEIDVVFPFNTAATTQAFNSLIQNTGNNASRINVRGDGNFIKIQDDSIKGYLPFFGEQRLNAGSYGGNDSAIQFGGIIEKYEKTINKKKSKLEIKFTTQQKGLASESYDVSLEIFPNRNVEVNIRPTFRSFIRYSGRLKQLKDKPQ